MVALCGVQLLIQAPGLTGLSRELKEGLFYGFNGRDTSYCKGKFVYRLAKYTKRINRQTNTITLSKYMFICILNH